MCEVPCFDCNQKKRYPFSSDSWQYLQHGLVPTSICQPYTHKLFLMAWSQTGFLSNHFFSPLVVKKLKSKGGCQLLQTTNMVAWLLTSCRPESLTLLKRLSWPFFKVVTCGRSLPFVTTYFIHDNLVAWLISTVVYAQNEIPNVGPPAPVTSLFIKYGPGESRAIFIKI